MQWARILGWMLLISSVNAFADEFNHQRPIDARAGSEGEVAEANRSRVFSATKGKVYWQTGAIRIHSITDGGTIDPRPADHSLHDCGQAPAIQSAYLMRDRGPTPSPRPSLKAHFDAVLQLLEGNETEALKLAVQRSATVLGDPTSPTDAARRRAALRENRHRHLEVLRAYRDRGLFPINDYGIASSIPVFVDRRDTACAVGHLMRASGATAAVQEIAETNRFVYVPDVEAGPLVDWILTSGLTQEEAALIQPNYVHPPDTQISHTELLEDGEYVAEGMRFRKLEKEEPILADGASLKDDADLIFTGGGSYHSGWFSSIGARFLGTSHFVSVGAASQWLTAPWLESTGSMTEASVVSYQFEVDSADSDSIGAVGIAVDWFENNRVPDKARGRILIESKSFDTDGNIVSEAVIDTVDENVTSGVQDVSGGDGDRIDYYKKLRIETRVTVWGEAEFGAVTYELHFVDSTPIKSSVEFDGPKKGTFTIESKVGVSYELVRSKTPGRNGVAIEGKLGSGEPLEFSFDDTDSEDSDSAYYWVERR